MLQTLALADRTDTSRQPGKKADDEVLYGDGSNSGQADAGSGAYNAGVPHGENAPQLNTLPEHRGGSGGILSQIT